MKTRVALGLGALLTLIGCSSGPSAPDAAVGDGSRAPGSVTPPDIPWLEEGLPPIAIAPCPEGWREVEGESGAVTCDPYPVGGAFDCPTGQAHFSGDAACVAIGSPCPGGDFSASLPADRRVVYVQPGATGDGTSSATPYGSVTEFGIGGLPMGTVIALSRGVHSGSIRLARHVVLWGACAAETTLMTSVAADREGVVMLDDAPGEVRDLTVANSPRWGIVLIGPGAEAVLDGVVVSRTWTLAVAAGDGARLAASRIVVRETQSRSGVGTGGRGLSVEAGGIVDATRALFERNHDVGVYASGAGTTLALADVVVRDTQSQVSDGRFGRGMTVQGDATATASRALFERNRTTGVIASQGGAASLSHVVVRDTESQASDSAGGRGLTVQTGSTANVARSLFERNREFGIAVSNPEASAGPSADSTTAVLANVVVRETDSRESDGDFGRGIGAQHGAEVDVMRASIARSAELGVFAGGLNTTITSSDIVVRDTTGSANDGRSGWGLGVQVGARVEMTRALLERNRDIGVYASDEMTEVTLADIVVRDTDAQMADGHAGRALNVQHGARAEVTRALFERSRDLGVFTGSPGTTAELSDVVVRETLARGCATTTCSDFPSGLGVGSFVGASLSLTRFLIAGSELCGLQIATNAQADLSIGEVRDNPIGVCMQIDGYDLERLTSGVRFVDNGVNFQGTTLPVPEPADPVSVGP